MMLTAKDFRCWKCGTSLAELPLPLSRLAECPACRAYQHVCRLCLHFVPGIPKQCDEQDAEEVKEKDRANFCDYFKPNPKAYKTGDAKTLAAKATLDSLFGGDVATDDKTSATRGKLDELFGKDKK